MDRTLQHRSGISRDSVVAIVLLIMFALLVAGILTYPYVRAERFTAESLFYVDSGAGHGSTTSSLSVSDRLTVFQKTQLAYLKSYFVAQAALRAPGVGSLSILAPHEDKVKWLRENLDVGFEEASEILFVKLHGTKEQAEDMRKLVDAVCDAYLKEVVFDEAQRDLVGRDAKVAAAAEMERRIAKLNEDKYDLASHSPVDKARLDTMQSKIEALTAVWKDQITSVESDTIKAREPDHIRLLQKGAVISDDNPIPGELRTKAR